MALPSAAAFTAAHRPLAALDRTGLEDLFRVWFGASGRRYICSVYPVGAPPAFDCGRAVVAAVRKHAKALEPSAEIAFVFQPAADDDLGVWERKARQCGANEWHVHLLAETAAARDFAASDLAPIHRAPGGLRLAA